MAGVNGWGVERELLLSLGDALFSAGTLRSFGREPRRLESGVATLIGHPPEHPSPPSRSFNHISGGEDGKDY